MEGLYLFLLLLTPQNVTIDFPVTLTNVTIAPPAGEAAEFTVFGCDEVSQETWDEVGDSGAGLESEPFEITATQTAVGDACDPYGIADSWKQRPVPE